METKVGEGKGPSLGESIQNNLRLSRLIERSHDQIATLDARFGDAYRGRTANGTVTAPAMPPPVSSVEYHCSFRAIDQVKFRRTDGSMWLSTFDGARASYGGIPPGKYSIRDAGPSEGYGVEFEPDEYENWLEAAIHCDPDQRQLKVSARWDEYGTEQLELSYSDGHLWYCRRDGAAGMEHAGVLLPGEYISVVCQHRNGVSFTTNRQRVLGIPPPVEPPPPRGQKQGAAAQQVLVRKRSTDEKLTLPPKLTGSRPPEPGDEVLLSPPAARRHVFEELMADPGNEIQSLRLECGALRGIVQRMIPAHERVLRELRGQRHELVIAHAALEDELSAVADLPFLVPVPAVPGAGAGWPGQPGHISKLPEELLLSIMLTLPMRDLFGATARVCKRWHTLVCSGPVKEKFALEMRFAKYNLGRLQPGMLEGHEENVTALTVCPADGTVFSGAEDNAIRVWDKGGIYRQSLAGHDGPVNALAISPDSKNMFSGSWDTTVRVWSLDGLAGGGGAVPHTRTLAGHGGGISAIATFPAGHEDLRMFSGSSDSTIKVWSNEGDLLQTIPTRAHVSSMVLSVGAPHGTVGAAAVMQLWVLSEAGRMISSWTLDGAHLRMHRVRHAVTALAMGADRKVYWSFSEKEREVAMERGLDKGMVCMHDDMQAAVVAMGDSIPKGNVRIKRKLARSLAIGPDGTIYTTASERHIHVW